MIKTLLITAGDLLFTKVSNIFQNPEQAKCPDIFMVSKARFKNCGVKTFSTPFSVIFLSCVVMQNFSKEVSGKIFDQRTVLFIFIYF